MAIAAARKLYLIIYPEFLWSDIQSRSPLAAMPLRSQHRAGGRLWLTGFVIRSEAGPGACIASALAFRAISNNALAARARQLFRVPAKPAHLMLATQQRKASMRRSDQPPRLLYRPYCKYRKRQAFARRAPQVLERAARQRCPQRQGFARKGEKQTEALAKICQSRKGIAACA